MDADNRKTTKPLTGEPDAGDPPVRFGGRGEAIPRPYPYRGRRTTFTDNFDMHGPAPAAAFSAFRLAPGV